MVTTMKPSVELAALIREIGAERQPDDPAITRIEWVMEILARRAKDTAQ